jgi:hypothetical protein
MGRLLQKRGLYTGHPAQKAGLYMGHLLQKHGMSMSICGPSGSIYGPPAAKPGLYRGHLPQKQVYIRAAVQIDRSYISPISRSWWAPQGSRGWQPKGHRRLKLCLTVGSQSGKVLWLHVHTFPPASSKQHTTMLAEITNSPRNITTVTKPVGFTTPAKAAKAVKTKTTSSTKRTTRQSSSSHF